MTKRLGRPVIRPDPTHDPDQHNGAERGDENPADDTRSANSHQAEDKSTENASNQTQTEVHQKPVTGPVHDLAREEAREDSDDDGN